MGNKAPIQRSQPFFPEDKAEALENDISQPPLRVMVVEDEALIANGGMSCGD